MRHSEEYLAERANKRAAQIQAFVTEWNAADDNTERKHACYSQYAGCSAYSTDHADFKRVVYSLMVGGMGDEAGAVVPDQYLQL